jgi:type II secretory pathway component PulJ
MKTLKNRKLAGVTLSEIMVSTGVFSIVMGTVLTSSISLQKTFFACEHYANSQKMISRALDAMGKDLRQAVQLFQSPNYKIKMEVTNFGTEGNPVTPQLLSNGTLQYLADKKYITYRLTNNDTTLLREETVGGVTTTTTLATDLSDFKIDPDIKDNGDSVIISASFKPKFSRTGSESLHDGTRITNQILLRNKKL